MTIKRTGKIILTCLTLCSVAAFSEGKVKTRDQVAVTANATDDGTDLSGMVRIPAGTNRGNDPDFGAYELTVDALYMDCTEVTKAQWDQVYTWAVANGYAFDSAGSAKGEKHPIDFVNWFDCVKWCNARSQMDGRTPCYTVDGSIYKSGQSSPECNFSANGYRLPTSDEWEYAARGGLSGKRFPWGDRISKAQASYTGHSHYKYDATPAYKSKGTKPVATFAANGYGLYDMAGNVWEWCNTSSGQRRVLRGGSWRNVAIVLRCGDQAADYPAAENWALSHKLHTIGFRCVRRGE